MNNLNDIIGFIVNNGIAVFLIYYFLKNNNNSMKELIKQNQQLILQNQQLIEELKEIRQDQNKILVTIEKCKKAG